MNRKGFSLVELIIVIAIMAVLIGLSAPAFMRFINRSKVVTDIRNANVIADAINVAVAEPGSGITDSVFTGVGGEAIPGIGNLETFPASKYDSDFEWKVTVDATLGVTEVTLDGKKVYPGENQDLAYYVAYYK